MPGGPSDPESIPSYEGHVARNILEVVDRGCLECVTRKLSIKRLHDVFMGMDAKVVSTATRSNLGGLPQLMFNFIDLALISTFVKRWQSDTNSFHMPFGEMTIMLHNVQHNLGLPVECEIITFGEIPQCSTLSAAFVKGEGILGKGLDVLKNLSTYRNGGLLESLCGISFHKVCRQTSPTHSF